jgi:hypothetical protein
MSFATITPSSVTTQLYVLSVPSFWSPPAITTTEARDLEEAALLGALIASRADIDPRALGAAIA